MTCCTLSDVPLVASDDLISLLVSVYSLHSRSLSSPLCQVWRRVASGRHPPPSSSSNCFLFISDAVVITCLCTFSFLPHNPPVYNVESNFQFVRCLQLFIDRIYSLIITGLFVSLSGVCNNSVSQPTAAE